MAKVSIVAKISPKICVASKFICIFVSYQADMKRFLFYFHHQTLGQVTIETLLQAGIPKTGMCNILFRSQIRMTSHSYL